MPCYTPLTSSATFLSGAEGFDIVGDGGGVLPVQAVFLKDGLDVIEDSLHFGLRIFRRVEHGIEFLSEPTTAGCRKRFGRKSGSQIFSQLGGGGRCWFGALRGSGNSVSEFLLLFCGSRRAAGDGCQ